MVQAFSVAAAIDKYVDENGSDHPYDAMWHPSAISGCKRKAIYAMRQVPETDAQTPKQKRILFLGSRFHEMTQAAVAAASDVVAVHTEVRVLVDELNLTGAADQLVLIERADWSAELQEYKSIAPYGFKKVVKENAPKEDHLEQLKSYMYALREFGGVADDGTVIEPLGDRLKTARFTYIDKPTFDTHEIVVEWDPAWEFEIRATIGELEMYRSHPDSLPPRLPMTKGKRDYRCDWGWGKCPFFTRCWDQDVDEIAVEF